MPAREMFIASDTITQSSADVAAESELKTGLGVNQSRSPSVWLIHQIEFLWDPQALDGLAAADSFVICQLTTKTETSVVGYDSDHLIDAAGLVVNADGTAASAKIFNASMVKNYSAPIPVVSDSIFLRIASAATGVANSVSYRMHYEVKKLGVDEFYRLIRVQA